MCPFPDYGNKFGICIDKVDHDYCRVSSRGPTQETDSQSSSISTSFKISDLFLGCDRKKHSFVEKRHL